MSSLENDYRYDLFVSYAHLDDDGGQVEALVRAIQEEHGRFTPAPLQVFFHVEVHPRRCRTGLRRQGN